MGPHSYSPLVLLSLKMRKFILGVVLIAAACTAACGYELPAIKREPDDTQHPPSNEATDEQLGAKSVGVTLLRTQARRSVLQIGITRVFS